LRTVPAEVSITRKGAFPLAVTGAFGIRNISLRAFLHLYRAGGRLIQRERIDLVYISTTMFPAMALGRLWRWRLGRPYVLDMQDPWVDDENAGARQLPKARWARMLHGVLEPFTMRRVSGLIAVSDAYHETLRVRYPWISRDLCLTVPFGASSQDFDEARRVTGNNGIFRRGDGRVHGIYAGAISPAMRHAARVLFRGLRLATTLTSRASDVRLVFVGTSYADEARAQKVVEDDAKAEGVEDHVTERPQRAPYFDALRLLIDADFLVILGSTDPHYVPSKLSQYLLARRPIVAIVHDASPIARALREVPHAMVTTFDSSDDLDEPAERLSRALADFLGRPAIAPDGAWALPARYDPRELTRQQCVVFDAVLQAFSEARSEPARTTRHA
jgi:hypothetical protein